MIHRAMKLFIVAIVFITLTGLSAFITRACAGPVTPDGRTALIESGPYTLIQNIDGVKVPGLKVAVLPGERAVEIKFAEQEQPYREYIFHTHLTGLVKFIAEEGRRYLVYIDIRATDGPADEEKGSGYRWVGYVVDRSTGKKIASTGPLALKVEPRNSSSGFAPNIPH